MSGLHLNHYIPWNELLERCYINKDPGIKLPICECGRILANGKKIQHQIKNRKYLNEKLCTAADYKIVGEKIFRKSEKRKLMISNNLYYLEQNDGKPKVKNFVEKLKTAIKEFAETERKKIVDRNIPEEFLQCSASYENEISCCGFSFDPTNSVEKYCENIKTKFWEDGKWPVGKAYIGEDACEWFNCSCKLFSILIEAGDSKTLLSFPNEKIKHALNCHHTWPAIGKNFHFLAYHVMQVYLYTNFIVVASLQDKPNEWGPMKPGSFFRESLMHDCDGQTFLFGCRKYLADEIYMKDFGAMKELCKKCFKFLYILEMLELEVGYENTTIIESLFDW